jgi:hypothetical protein
MLEFVHLLLSTGYEPPFESLATISRRHTPRTSKPERICAPASGLRLDGPGASPFSSAGRHSSPIQPGRLYARRNMLWLVGSLCNTSNVRYTARGLNNSGES